MELVDIHFTPGGQPLRVLRAGRVWHVGAEPTLWFERTRWWEDPNFRIAKGSGVRIDYAVWRVQVRLGHNPRSELTTWDLIENPQARTWLVRELQTNQIAS